ncbi:hypothetical protein K503DRAFT_771316 [Rhizopogon vinicolor AM-OR11-026]|uniref:Uncharacterized protein n=1 Tax=Rhizopogon vinicolor AM-OR11-026 TaxID=1314800 RepID=A0A1B7MYD9_9AGAM|nr:hypothetical protein K503DRAFT_771316 [Rhizopogon vinicolor AM-OR11-026]
MIPKFANPHSRSQDFELVSRAQLRFDTNELADAEGVSDVELVTSKHKLHELLLSHFGESLSSASDHAPRKKKRRKENGTTPSDAEDCMILFRLLSSTGGPRIISTVPKPPPPPKTRSPDYEDNPMRADERMIRAQSVAVDSAWVEAQSQRRFEPRIQDDQKLVRVRGSLPDPHPAVMVTECHRHQTARTQTPTSSSPGASNSPKSLRATCTILPIDHLGGSQLHHEARAKAKRKRSYERPPPAYWRPDSNQRGKCMGYALGYPGSWSVRYEGDPRKRWYVRDMMRKAAFST